MVCRSCGKHIEADAAFCRYCGTRQDPVGGTQSAAAASSSAMDPAPPGATMTGGGSQPVPSTLESRLRHLFPRHHQQDEFMHLATIVAFVIAVVGFIFGFLSYAIPVGGLAVTWLLFAIALLLFLMVRESTLSHVRGRADGSAPAATRYHAARSSARPRPVEAATAESSPPEPESAEP